MNNAAEEFRTRHQRITDRLTRIFFSNIPFSRRNTLRYIPHIILTDMQGLHIFI